MNHSERKRNSEKIYWGPLAKIATGPLVGSKTGGVSGTPPAEIVDSGPSWRRFICALSMGRASIAIFSFVSPTKRPMAVFTHSAGNLVKL
jgi:hypothetical protein